MRNFVLFAAVACASATYCCAQEYTNKYDKINLDEVLGNKRLLASYVKCMLDEGKCTSEGNILKSHIADALQTGCAKCTDAQKAGARTAINYLIINEPDYWNKLVQKYDAERNNVRVYEKDLNAEE